MTQEEGDRPPDTWKYLSKDKVKRIKGHVKSLLGSAVIQAAGFMLVVAMNAML